MSTNSFETWFDSEMAKYRDDDDMTRALLRAKENMRAGFSAGIQNKEALTVSLRDKFAMAALTGLLSNSGGVIQFNSMYGTGYANGDSEGVASWAYELADAMLKEREK